MSSKRKNTEQIPKKKKEEEVEEEEEEEEDDDDWGLEDDDEEEGQEEEGEDGDEEEQEDEEGDEDDEMEEDLDDDDDEDNDKYDEIDIDFIVDNPKAIDFHGIKTLLTSSLKNTQLQSSELVDAILSQEDITSVIRVDGDDEMFGFLSVLNYQQHKKKEGMVQLKKYLLSETQQGKEKEKEKEKKEMWKALFEDEKKPLGVVFNERMFNVPAQLALPLFQRLLQGVEQAVEDDKEENPSSRSPFDFENFIFFTTYQKQAQKSKTQQPKNKKAKTSSTSSSSNNNNEEPETIFSKMEDEFLQKEAFLQCSFPIKVDDQVERWTLRGKMATFGLVMAVKKDKMNAVLEQLEKQCS